MNDKYLMENIMYGSKVVNDLYLHGVIESANEAISVVFMKALQEVAKMHFDLYKEMENANFYQVTNVDASKINKTKNKLEKACNNCPCEEKEN